MTPSRPVQEQLLAGRLFSIAEPVAANLRVRLNSPTRFR